MAAFRCRFLQTLVHHIQHLCRHLPGSANRWKTLIICLVFPPCLSGFKYNRTELDESAAGLPNTSASLPKLKGKGSHFRGLNQRQKYPCCLKVSDSPVIFCSLDTQAETDLKGAENRWVLIHDRSPRQYGNGICSHYGLTVLKDQNAEDSYVQHVMFS